MRKGFRSLPGRILAAVLTAGMIVSSSNLEYVRFILPGVDNVSNVEAAELTTETINDENLLKAMEVYVNYQEKGNDIAELKERDIVNDPNYLKFQTPITVQQAGNFVGDIDLSGCMGIKDLTGIDKFYRMKSINISNYSGTVISNKSFQNCSELTTVIIPNSVTSIGNFAFNNCTKLKTIEVAGDTTNNKEGILNLYNVSNVGESAFAAAMGFEGVVFDKNKTELKLGSNAFNKCTGLLSIDIPTKASGNLGQGVFESCENLKKVTLNDSITVIPNEFFHNADLSQMDKFPTALEKIGIDAFMHTSLLTPDLSKCTNLKLIDQGAFQVVDYTYNAATGNKFILPDKLAGDGEGDATEGTGIRRIAFFNSTLQKINIPDGITVIQDSVFEGCELLDTVEINTSSKLTKIDDWAFRRCCSLNNTKFISKLSELKEIGKSAFSECYWLRYDNENKKYAQDDYDVYVIGGGLSSVTLPDSLETLGDYAFANNYNVSTITMGNNIKIIPDYAFSLRADTSHMEINIEGLSEVKYYNFNQVLLSYTGKLTEVTLSKQLTDIGVGAFKYNTHLSTVTYNDLEKEKVKEGTLELPTTVTKIGNNAFSDCARWSAKDIDGDGEINYVSYGLGKIDLTDLKLDEFGESVFENDYMLDTVILPTNLKVIPKKLFYVAETEPRRIYKTRKATRINAEGKEEDYDQRYIEKIYGLNSVTFPEDLEEIGDSAFEGCENFEYKGKVWKCDEQTNEYKTTTLKYTENDIDLFQLPMNLQSIGNRVFFGCRSIGKVALNPNIESIGSEAFSQCSILDLNPVSNPNTSFERGFGLTNVTFKPATKLETIGSSAFSFTVISNADLSNNKLLETIPEALFSNCYYLQSALIPENVTQMAGTVFSTDVSLKIVQLPAIATIATNIFSGISSANVRDMGITLSARNKDRLIRVPIGQSIKINYIKVTPQTPNKSNEYIFVQKIGENVLKNDSDKFITETVNEQSGDVTLTGIKETEENSVLSITNNMKFEALSSTGATVLVTKPIHKDFDLTVSEVWAEKLAISDPKEAIEVDENGSKVLNISADKITGNDDSNFIEVTSSVEPSPLTKVPVWETASSDVITVDPIDPDDSFNVKTVNESNKSKAKVHVKGVGTTKLWVVDKADTVQKIKAGTTTDTDTYDEITVNVVYPVDPTKTTVSVGTLDSDTSSFQLEEGSEDTITVTPGYTEAGIKAGEDSRADIYFISTNPDVVTVDRVTGKVTAQNKTGSSVIRVFDETGKLLRDITVSVVEEGKLTPNLINIKPQRINVYEDQETDKIIANVMPAKVNQKVTWSVANEEVAILTTNEDGSATIKGRTLGETVLRATSVDNPAVYKDIVVNVAAPATTLKFQKTDVSLAVDTNIEIPMTNEENENLSLLYLPAKAGKDSVTWKIEDESIAQFVDTTNRVTLANGVPVIKGIKQGKTKLTATTGTGLIASLNISVFKPVTEFSVDEKRTVHIGESFDLKVNKTPADSSEPFTYVSSNLEIATVDANGKVKGIKEGTVVISAINSRNEARACTVSVVSKVAQITILDAPIEIAVEGVYTIGRASEDPAATIGYRLTPNSIDELTWTSSDSNVASVESGNGAVSIKGVGPGTAVITAKSFSGASATINVSVVSVNTELKFTEESKRIAIGTQAAVTVNKTPADATESIVYTSSNEEIATVDQNGVVTAKAKGDVTIYAKGKVSNVTAGIPVTVTVPATSIKAITHFASEKKIYLVKGSTYQFRYRILPEDTTDTVKFTTSKKKVATVAEDGTITAKKKGSATITVKTESGKIAKIKVYVVNKEKNAKKIKKISTSSIKVGKTVRLKYTVTSATTTNSVTYSVNKPEIATIDEFGYITGLKKGKVKVTVTMSNGKQKTKTIKVKK